MCCHSFRRRARSPEASVASFVTLAHPPLCAVQGCMGFAAASDSSSSALGRRRARLLEASVASFVTLAHPPLCAVQGCAWALLQPLILRRRL
eukprot:scaffold14227_cov37-Phaeocystis_antarctica.AAC.2